MKSYLKSIVIFNEYGEKRVVPLKQGVNIITGESKTGKSALVEIIDYCLCSTRCTIPKGKITDFSYLYVLIIQIGENTYIIARQNWENGGKMYFSKENHNFDDKNIELNYFEGKVFLPNKDVQYEIECALGLLVSNMVSNEEIKGKKASLRNMVSYMFQHQNLMASKFALFYRFSDYYKRKDIIGQFPVFAGMIGQEYYSDLIELNSLSVQLKQKYKKQQANKKSTELIKEKLMPLLADYHALLEMDFDKNVSIQQMIELAIDLPEFDDRQFLGDSKIVERYDELKEKIEVLRNEEREILIKINNVNKASNTGNEFLELLQELNQQTNIIEIKNGEYVCPICGHDCHNISSKDNEIIEAKMWLENELMITEKHTTDFSEDVRKLKEVHTNIDTEIRNVWKQMKFIEENYISSKKLASKKEKISFAKAKIAVYAEMFYSGIFENVDEEINELKKKIEQLEIKINRFNVEEKLLSAQAFISENMNRLSKTLDFETEYRPINLNFDLVNETFDLYHLQNGESKIDLSEMGSGANWVSCHIALFLSFLHFFAKQENSPMPLIMFFDQPSQVYFPHGENDGETNQADLIGVNAMYKTIFNEIESIGEETGFLPQIIIVDHVNGDYLECKNEFENYVRCNWRNGAALI